MAKPGRKLEIEREYGESFDTLIPRLLNELGSVTAVSRKIKYSESAVWHWVTENGYVKVPQWIKIDRNPKHGTRNLCAEAGNHVA